jgi:hypothetical protein
VFGVHQLMLRRLFQESTRPLAKPVAPKSEPLLDTVSVSP